MPKNNAREAFRLLKNRLKPIDNNDDRNIIEKFNDGSVLINDFLLEVRKMIISNPFTDKFEEIYFFKFEKPEYFSYKIYRKELFILLKQKPTSTENIIKEYFLEELKFISRFFKQHAFLYEYFRSGYTELDDILFLRNVSMQSALFPEPISLDIDFSTSGDYIFAQFIAYEGLQEFILGQLKQMDQIVSPGVIKSKKKWFDWTGEVINLVELGYGLYLSKQIGQGKAGLQEIFNWLEETFGVEIGIPANRFREIKRRKRLSRILLTDLIRDSLIGYMDSDNE
ncbi:RteC domain-containing protein [Mucilaginibacter polytrichastri]|uniref:RteC protein n=1 Tax=Mucilaginibacter polytrichastri TaxID=1302689 RepID=A0A1Q5ZWM3_9SPHI|nr:RteC domain-containing protein [Mucilaginibacter polytrichastri]OKS86143.1 hypothetical protein RG47T_1593 [Mucilaginibacter polytrichastri]SFT15309.1 RteC protein [Mucilaginibacter polytrichastri]